MAIKIYGIVRSRALRCMWMLEELGLPYEQVPVAPREGTRTPEFLKINPNGHVPTLQDGNLTLFESMAINMYLAMKYNKGLWPASLEDQARCAQWSFWGMLETEAHLLSLLRNRLLLPENERNEAEAKEAIEGLQAPLRVINDHLAGKANLLGDAFTLADLNVAGVLNWALRTKVDLSAYPDLSRWLRACTSRPAFKAALAKK